MAQQAHESGGVVFYVDRSEPNKQLEAFVDMYFQLDIEVWALLVVQHFELMHKVFTSQLQDRVRVVCKHTSRFKLTIVIGYQNRASRHVK
jgi:hypothetical protein